MKNRKIAVVAISVLMFSILMGCKEHSKNKNIERPVIKTTLQVSVIDTLLYPLDYLYSTFSNFVNDPYIGTEAIALINAYSDIKQEFLYLDSISEMNIDFIGVAHNGYHNEVLEVQKSQDSLSRLISQNKWGCIGYESSSKFGFLNKQDLLKSVRDEFLHAGMDTSFSNIMYALNMNRKGDILQQHIEKGSKNIIGTEQEEVWRLQQKITFVSQMIDPDYEDLLMKSRLALNQVRSSISIVRTAKIMRKYNLQNGVIVFGGNHLDDFIWLQRKFGLESKFYAL